MFLSGIVCRIGTRVLARHRIVIDGTGATQGSFQTNSLPYALLTAYSLKTLGQRGRELTPHCCFESGIRRFFPRSENFVGPSAFCP